jgi:phosphoribosylanthranilate isomerase
MSETRTRIKICGITNQEDARAAIEYGADALGFILVSESPRYIGDKTTLQTLLADLPPFVSTVGVCRTPAQVGNEFNHAFDTVQFYERDGYNSQDGAGRHLIHAFRIRDAASLEAIAGELETFRLDAILLDTYHKDKLGGSGETFNWELAVEAKRRFDRPIILAGGLTPDNVEEAIRTVRPYAVDVSSGVEAEPGRKDHAKLKAFFQAVRRADASL